MDEDLSLKTNVNDKYEYLLNVSKYKEKNRFSCSEIKKQKKNIFRVIKRKLNKFLK